MNAFTNPETIKRAQELANAICTGQTLPQQHCIELVPTQQYNHFTCSYGEIVVPQNIILPEDLIYTLRILLDAYACTYNASIQLRLQGYTDENNMRFVNDQGDILFVIDNGKISIIRN